MSVLDKFLEKIPAEQWDLVRALDQLIIHAAPDLRASLKWGNLTYHHMQNVCSIVSHKHYINLQFWDGVHLNDPLQLLTGCGKKMRHIRIEKSADLQLEYIDSLVKHAANKAGSKNQTCRSSGVE